MRCASSLQSAATEAFIVLPLIDSINFWTDVIVGSPISFAPNQRRKDRHNFTSWPRDIE
jgi:hypothetical protein